MTTINQQAFDLAVDELLADRVPVERYMSALAERFPDLRRDQFDALFQNTIERIQAREAKNLVEARAMDEAIVRIWGDDLALADLKMADAVAIKAAAGDAFAQAIRDDPRFRIAGSLFQAAAEAHPNWVAAGNGWKQIAPSATDKVDPNGAAERLVDWFIDEFPAEAAAICEALADKRGAA